MKMKKFDLGKLLFGIITAVAGLVTVILAIIKLADGDADPSKALRIILGVLFCLVGLCTLLVALIAKGDEQERNSLVVEGSLSIGFGAFLFTQWGGGFLDIGIAFLFPVLVAAFGGGLLVKGIVDLAQKKDQHACVFEIVAGSIMLAIGTVFACFADDWAGKVMWLFVGLVIMAVGIVQIIRFVKVSRAA